MTTDPLVGRTLGPYSIERRLGGGGMAIVYQGTHQDLGLARAIKVMSSTLATDEGFVRLFYREARMAAGLRHPNIVQIFDVAQQDGLHYLVMELLEGRSLRDVIRNDAPLPLARVVNLVGQLTAALDHAHRQGVAHRDVKPANAFVSPSDALTLVDFGIARAADATHLTVTHGIGTPGYMAPEVFDERLAAPGADDHAIGVGTDLYSLGIVTYELLTGTVPFVGRTPNAVAYAQVNMEPPAPSLLRPDLPPAVEAVILRQLAKSPTQRYRSAQAFATALAETVAQAIGRADLGQRGPVTLLHVEPGPLKPASSPAGRPEPRRGVASGMALPSSNNVPALFTRTEPGAGASAALRHDATVAEPVLAGSGRLGEGQVPARATGAGSSATPGRAALSRGGWLAPAAGLLLLGGVFSLPAMSGGPWFSPASDNARLAQSRVGSGTLAAAVTPTAPQLPTSTPQPTLPATPAPTSAPPASTPVAAVPDPSVAFERRVDETIAQAFALIAAPDNPNADLALEQLERVYRELDPGSAKRQVVEELMIRALLEESRRRQDVAFVLKEREEGRVSHQLLADADRRLDRAAQIRPHDAALTERASKGREQVALAGWWVDFDVAYRAGRNDAQIEALTRIVTRNPGYRTPEGPALEKLYAAWIAKAEEAWAARQAEQARQALDEAAKVDPNHPRTGQLRVAWFPPRPAPVRAAAPRPGPAWTASSLAANPEPETPARAAPAAQPPQRQFVEVYVEVVEQGSVDHNQPINSD